MSLFFLFFLVFCLCIYFTRFFAPAYERETGRGRSILNSTYVCVYMHVCMYVRTCMYHFFSTTSYIPCTACNWHPPSSHISTNASSPYLHPTKKIHWNIITCMFERTQSLVPNRLCRFTTLYHRSHQNGEDLIV